MHLWLNALGKKRGRPSATPESASDRTLFRVYKDLNNAVSKGVLSSISFAS